MTMPWQMTQQERARLSEKSGNQDSASIAFAASGPDLTLLSNIDNAPNVEQIPGVTTAPLINNVYSTSNSTGEVNLVARALGLEDAAVNLVRGD